MTEQPHIVDVHVVENHVGLCITYRGEPDELIAQGAITAEALLPGRRGARRFDDAGDRLWISRRRDQSRIRVVRWKPLERATGLPGVHEWVMDRHHPLAGFDAPGEALQRQAGGLVEGLLQRFARPGT